MLLALSRLVADLLQRRVESTSWNLPGVEFYAFGVYSQTDGFELRKRP